MTYIRRALLAIVLSFGLAPAFAQVPAAVPALPDTERRTSYSITATTCACNVNFALYGDSTDYQNWVEVFINGVRYDYNDASHGWTITSPSGSLSGLARPITNAVLTFNAVQTGTVQIVGARRPRRTAQFSENTGVSARNLNQVFTDIIAQNREIWDKNNDMTGRGLFGLPGESISTMPAAASRAGKFLGFDATGLIPQMTAAGPGSGNVVGPASSTVGNVALFNNTTGTLLSDAGGGAASHPILHPSSSNLVGSGCVPAEAHSVWWVDQNVCSIADELVINSSDPSALLQFVPTGSVTSAKLQTLTFFFGSGACVAGCAATYTTIGGDTLATVATAMMNAIKANPNLYNNVAGAQKQILATQGAAAGYIGMDFDSRVAMRVTASDAGGTINYNLPASCATACANAWDNNPILSVNRNPGIAPPVNSQLFNLQVGSTNSAAPTQVNTVYANLSAQALNSTSGSISGRWLLGTPDINGLINQGLYVGAGPYTVGVADKGLDTFNTKVYWTNGAYSFGQTAGQFLFDTKATTNPFVFSASGATVMGVNMTPTGTLDAAGTISALGSGGVPTTGQGVSLVGGSAPIMQSINWATSAYLAQSFVGLSWDFKPSASATSGWTLSANSLVPDGDNVTALGSGSKRISSVTSPLIAGGSGAGSSLTLESTSGAGTTDFINFKVNSQAEVARIYSNGFWGINTGASTPVQQFTIFGGLQLSGTTNGPGLRTQVSGSFADFLGINNDNNANNPISFSSQVAQAVRIFNSGGVSINTATDPGAGALLANTSLKATTTVTAVTGYNLNTKLAWSATAPTVSSGFCTSPSISNNNGTAAFTVTIGSACAAATGVLTMPAASIGWACNFRNVTNNAANAPSQTASTTTSVNVTNYVRTTGVAGNWTASDVIVADCTAY